MSDLSVFESDLRTRAENKCELCGTSDELSPVEVPPKKPSVDTCALLCATCRAQLDGSNEAQESHWFCLRESIWSDVAPVQVLSYRLLKSLESADWAADLLGQAYLDEERLEWAQSQGSSVVTLDSNGTPLADGDSVTLIKDLEVKGGGFTAKRGTMVKNIRLIDDPDNIEGRVNKMTLVLKTKFLKKVS